MENQTNDNQTANSETVEEQASNVTNTDNTSGTNGHEEMAKIESDPINRLGE